MHSAGRKGRALHGDSSLGTSKGGNRVGPGVRIVSISLGTNQVLICIGGQRALFTVRAPTSVVRELFCVSSLPPSFLPLNIQNISSPPAPALNLCQAVPTLSETPKNGRKVQGFSHHGGLPPAPSMFPHSCYPLQSSRTPSAPCRQHPVSPEESTDGSTASRMKGDIRATLPSPGAVP